MIIASPDPSASIVPSLSPPHPLDAIYAEHESQYDVCRRLEALIETLDTAPSATEAAALKVSLEADLPRHEADEAEILFPLLLRRCQPQDRIDAVVARLYAEHARDETLVEYIIDDLGLVASGFRLANPVRLTLNVRSFVDMQRRHLAWENEVVLPLARRRLTAEDLLELGQGMAARRGLEHPG